MVLPDIHFCFNLTHLSQLIKAFSIIWMSDPGVLELITAGVYLSRNVLGVPFYEVSSQYSNSASQTSMAVARCWLLEGCWFEAQVVGERIMAKSWRIAAITAAAISLE